MTKTHCFHFFPLIFLFFISPQKTKAQEPVSLGNVDENFLKYFGDTFGHFGRRKRSIPDAEDFVYNGPQGAKETHSSHPAKRITDPKVAPAMPPTSAPPRAPPTAGPKPKVEPERVDNTPWAELRKRRQQEDPDYVPPKPDPVPAPPVAVVTMTTEPPVPALSVAGAALNRRARGHDQHDQSSPRQDDAKGSSEKDSDEGLTEDQVRALRRAGFQTDHVKVKKTLKRNLGNAGRKRREQQQESTKGPAPENKIKRELTQSERNMEDLRARVHNGQQELLKRIERKIDQLDENPLIVDHHEPLPIRKEKEPDGSGLVFFNVDQGGGLNADKSGEAVTKETTAEPVSGEKQPKAEELPRRKRAEAEGKEGKEDSGSPPFPEMPFGYAATPGLLSTLFHSQFPIVPDPLNPQGPPIQAPGPMPPLTTWPNGPSYRDQSNLLPLINQHIQTGAFPRPPASGILPPGGMARAASLGNPMPATSLGNPMPAAPYGYPPYIPPYPPFPFEPNGTMWGAAPEPDKSNPYSGATHVAVVPGLKDTGLYKVLTKYDSLVPIAGNTKPALGHFVHKLAPRADAPLRRGMPSINLVRQQRRFEPPRLDQGLGMLPGTEPSMATGPLQMNTQNAPSVQPPIPTYHNIPLASLYHQPYTAGAVPMQPGLPFPFSPNVPHYLYPGIPNPPWAPSGPAGGYGQGEKEKGKKEESKPPAAAPEEPKKKREAATPGPSVDLRIIEPSPAERDDFKGNPELKSLVPSAL